MTYTMALANGQTFAFTSRKPVTMWRSRLMRMAPYGTDFDGAMWGRK